MKKLILLTLIFGVLLVSCGEAGKDIAREPDVAIPQVTVIAGSDNAYPTTEASTGTPLPKRIAGSMTCAGGAAYRRRETQLYTDGTVITKAFGGFENERAVVRSRAPEAQVRSLRATFASKEWQQLGAKYGKEHPDSISCSVVGGGKEVESVNGQGPPILIKVQDHFIRIESTVLGE